MNKLNRRDVLASLGALGGSALLAGCGGRLESASPDPGGSPDRPAEQPGRPADAPSAASPPSWKYARLDPDEIAERAYRIYPDGSCMYGIVGAVIGALADRFGEPFRSFPVEMTRYGTVGMGGWGSLCGVVNGGGALIGLFYSEKDKTRREQLIAELCAWYESTALPVFKPVEPGWADEVEAVVPDSLLCHVSSARWCKATGCESHSAERRERCRRMTADGAAKVVEILNRAADGAGEFARVSPDVRACVECHGERELADSKGLMRCQTCHDLPDPHPALTSGLSSGN
jgi:hypothetical protein